MNRGYLKIPALIDFRLPTEDSRPQHQDVPDRPRIKAPIEEGGFPIGRGPFQRALIVDDQQILPAVEDVWAAPEDFGDGGLVGGGNFLGRAIGIQDLRH